jgi:hypothetical protein
VPLTVTDDDLTRLRDTLPKMSGTGLPNHLLDPRQPHWITSGTSSRHRAFHDIITGEPQRGGTALATYNGEVCAVETAQTVWTGFRPGFDHACIFPLPLMHKWGEPAWPFDVSLSADAEGRAAAREWIVRIVEKAGIEPRLHVSLNGKPAPHIEVLCRADSAGNALLFLINQEAKGGVYRLSGGLLSAADAVCEIRSGTRLDKAADGHVSVNIPAFDVVMLAAGAKSFVAERLAAHKAIKADVKPMPVSQRSAEPRE